MAEKSTQHRCTDVVTNETVSNIDLERSIEGGATKAELLSSKGNDSNLVYKPESKCHDLQLTFVHQVTWENDQDLACARNWPNRRKWTTTLLLSLVGFVNLMSSTMIAPAIGHIAVDLSIHSSLESYAVFSVVNLAYAITPFFLGPLSEMYGRKVVLVSCQIWFLTWSLINGFANSSALMIACRFLSAIGGGVTFSVGPGILHDCWSPEERGKSLSIYTLLPLMGPTVGPIIGGFVTDSIGWPWLFWIATILSSFVCVLVTAFFKETHSETILSRKAKSLRKSTGNPKLYSPGQRKDTSLGRFLYLHLRKPFIFLFTHPIIQLVALYQAYAYGLLYLVFSTFASLWTSRYHESTAVSGLHFIAFLIGETVAGQVAARLQDVIYAALKRRRGNGVPEFRVPILGAAGFLMVIGLFWYGWSAQAHLQWIMPDIGMALYACGNVIFTQAISAYIIDTYGKYSASATAAGLFTKSIAGFVVPLFGPKLYAKLDYGWGNSLLAFMAMAIGIPVPLILWNYGACLRARSSL